jgi:hypothetical protein
VQKALGLKTEVGKSKSDYNTEKVGDIRKCLCKMGNYDPESMEWAFMTECDIKKGG